MAQRTRYLLLLHVIGPLFCGMLQAETPENDAFANAILLPPPPSSGFGTAVDATVEVDEPAIWGSERTVWWRWLATRSGSVALISDRNPAPMVTVFSGAGLTNLTVLTSRILSHFSPIIFRVEEGVTYYLRFHAAEEIDFRFEAAPDNDAFASAFPLVGRFSQFSGDNTLASMEPGEAGEGGWSEATLWWKWVAPDSGRFRLSTNGSEAAVEAWLVQGSLSNFQVLMDAGNGGSGVDVVEGETYYIRVASPNTRRGRFVISVFPSTPVNDRFANRIVLSGSSGRVIGTNLGATNEPGERLIDPANGAARSTVWWSWTAPADGRFMLTCPTAPFVRFNLAIYSGTSLRRLSRLAFGRERISAPVIQGRTYAIQIDGVWNVRDDFTFDYQLLTTPTNDAISGAIPLAGSFVRITNDNSAATVDRGEPKVSAEATGASLWYFWTAPKSGWCWIKAESLDSYVVASVPYARVYETGVSNQRITATKQDGSLSSKGGFPVSQGTTYWIVVDTSYGRRGLMAMELDLTTLQMQLPADDSIIYQGEPPVFSIPAVDAAVDGSLQTIELVFAQEYGSPVLVESIPIPPTTFEPTNLPSGRHEFHIRATNFEGRERISPPMVLLVRPTHDDFDRRIRVSGYDWQASAPFQGATRELNEPLGGRPSLWFSWTAPASGEVRLFAYFSPKVVLTLAAFTGDALGSLTRVPSRSAVERSERVRYLFFPAMEGVTYHIGATVDSITARRGFGTVIAGTLYASELVLPAGATFEEGSPVPLTVATSERPEAIQRIEFYERETLIGAVTNGTTFIWSNAPCGVHYVTAIVRKFGDFQPPPVSGQLVTITPRNDHFSNAAVIESFPAVVQSCTSSASRERDEPMHRGLNGSGSVWWRFHAPANGRLRVAQSGQAPFFHPYFALYTGNTLARLTLIAANGDPQYGKDDIEADLVGGTTYYLATSSDRELRFRFFPPPANDDFDDSIQIEGTSTTVHGHTVLATSEAGEPLHSQYAGENTIWWHWVAPTNGSLRLEVSSTPGTAVLAVYEGAGVDELVPIPPIDGGRWIVRAGRTYRFAVASSWFGGTEQVSLHLEYQSAAANDMFSSAIPLFGEFVTFDASTVGATAEPGEPTPLNAAGTSLWWKWMAPRSGTMRIQGDGVPGGGLVFEVFIGDSLETLVPVSFIERFFRRRQFNAVQGQVYHIMADSIMEFPAADGVELFFEPPRP